MILMKDGIYKQNVISKKDMFYIKDMKSHLALFMNHIRDMKVTPKDKVFYMIGDVPNEEIMKVEFFIPIREEVNTSVSGIRFHSYFGIDNMMSIRVKLDKDGVVMAVYRDLIDTINARGMIRTTGFFHVLSEARGEHYITIKVGYR